MTRSKKVIDPPSHPSSETSCLVFFNFSGLIVPRGREADHSTFLKDLENKCTFSYLVDVFLKIVGTQDMFP